MEYKNEDMGNVSQNKVMYTWYINTNDKFSANITIPTTDSIRNTFLINLNLGSKKNMLIVGNTGTGKTVNVISELNLNYFNDTYSNLITAFSGKSNCN